MCKIEVQYCIVFVLLMDNIGNHRYELLHSGHRELYTLQREKQQKKQNQDWRNRQTETPEQAELHEKVIILYSCFTDFNEYYSNTFVVTHL